MEIKIPSFTPLFHIKPQKAFKKIVTKSTTWSKAVCYIIFIKKKPKQHLFWNLFQSFF